MGTFDGRPYEAPFSGNIIELCPVGALTTTSYRFRARPWDIEDAGSVCTLCPSQCNISFTVRDERVERVLARDNDAVDDGWLCDKGRWGYQAVHPAQRITRPLVRDGGMLRDVSWERALDEAVAGSAQGRRRDHRTGGRRRNQRGGYLLAAHRARGARIVQPGLPRRRDARPATARMLSHPSLAAGVADIDAASVVLVLETDPMHEAPIIDLRVRKAVRRAGARLVVAGSRPTALDGGAVERLSCAPGTAEALLRALQKSLLDLEDAASDAG